MKYTLLFAICLIFRIGLSQTFVDTVTITLDIQNDFFTPQRGCVMIDDLSNPSLSNEFIDSIKVQGIVINKSNQHFYLILKDLQGTVRYEGNYFDEFATGYVIAYNSNGSKKYEGNYVFKKYNKPKVVCAHGKTKLYKSMGAKRKGTWKFYDTNGNLIKRKKY